MAEGLTSSRPWASLFTHCYSLASEQDTLAVPCQSEANHERPKSGWWPNSWKSLPLPQNIWNNPPTYSVQFRSITESCPTLRPHGLQHTRPPCPSPTPRVYPNSCPLSPWCHQTISSYVISFSSSPQSFPSGSFQMSQLFTSGGQNIGVSASTVLLVNI